ncbi:TIGR02453 family protein [Pedobacter suwonensis]|uniref:TIGR02453 family protein n=1 Tax=Pedobacter suwonensis TaxID=332999 RepID=A0A1I0U6M2_9SPHI|nr:DUF2461 domain-containing protein [Pedobacter suwonensis]SFA59543.1 TIGR02453 family protein [Pedobacter suwonensis]
MPDIKQIPLSSFEFLRLLKNNNEPNWFNDHKTAYQKELGYIESFAQQLLDLMNTHDVIETASGKKSLYRIYRDTRFSNDKTPYKTHWSGSFKRAGKQRRGGYYFHIEPGNSFVAGGFFGPSPQDLKLIREQISFDAAPLREILSVEYFASFFGALKGEQLKTAPKGFDSDHQDIDLLRYKQFLLIHQFTDEEVLSTDFLGYCNQGFKNMRPFFDYMSEILTTDANGMDL